MYAVAEVLDGSCVAKKGCRLCIMYCPEPNTILFDREKEVATVIEPRCKGCELCVVVCSAAKHNAISLVPR